MRELASVLQEFLIRQMHLVESANVSMDLNTIKEVAHPQKREQLPVWTAGDAWLAGGTWLFSEPQVHLTRLIDLTDLKWPALTIGEDRADDRGDLHGRAARRPGLPARMDRRAPDQPMLPRVSGLLQDMEDRHRRRQSLHVVAGRSDDLADRGARRRLHDLEGRWQRADASNVADFVTGNQRNVLAPGDLLRQIDIPLAALKRRAAFRQISLTPVGRSAALLIGSLSSDGALALTVTASTVRPIQLSFARNSRQRSELREAILHRIPDELYHDDVHGKPAWRKHMTLRLAEEIRAELQGLV